MVNIKYKRKGLEMVAKTLTSHATPRWYLPKRFIVVLLGFVGVVINYVIRGDLSVAMVAMVNHTGHSTVANHSYSFSECPVALVTDNVTERVFKGARYNWDSVTQGYIMSAFFYCYFAFVLIGGYVAERYGAARMFGLGLLSASLLSFFIPLVAKYGIIPLIVVRSLQGICGGVTQPSMCAVVSKWSPKLERSVIMTIIFTGSIMSSVIANPISGWLATLDFMGGWPAIFYFSGIAGCVWYILWFIFVYESPRVHPSITEDELRHFDIDTDKRRDVPWKDIFTSLPFWSVLLAFFAAGFTFNILFTELPTYLSTVLHFNIKNSGMLSTLPFLAESISAWITSFICDKLRASGRWSITTIRKAFNSLGGYVLCACLIGITFSGCNASLIIGLLTFGMFIDGCKFSGFHATTIDISPEFAGTLYGLQYGISSLFSAQGPLMVGALTLSGATVHNWSKVFYVTAAIKFIATTAYAIFASSEPQIWGKDKKLEKIAIVEAKI